MKLVNEIWDRYRGGRLSIGQKRVVWSKRYKKTLPPIGMTMRSAWPEGIPLRMAVTTDFDGPFPCTIRLRPRFEGGTTVVVYSGAHRDRWSGPFAGMLTEWMQVVGTPPPGTTEVFFDVDIEEGGRRIWSGVTSYKVKIGGAIGDVLPPLADADVIADVVAAVRGSARLSADGRWLIVESATRKIEAGVAIALRFELVRDGNVAATSSVRWPLPSAYTGARVNYFGREGPPEEWCQVIGDLEKAAAAAAKPDGWRLRVVGDGEAALCDISAKQYWAGEFEFPLDPAGR